MTRPFFTFFLSFEEAISGLEMNDQYLLYKSIVRYGLFGEEPELTGIPGIIWKLILPNLRNSRKQYENGLKGGAPKGNINALKKGNDTLENDELTMSKKKEDFYKSLVPFVSIYGKEMVREFFEYWTEPNKSKTKMRFELERTWDAKRRLNTWASMDNNFSKHGNNRTVDQTEEQRAADAASIIARRLAEDDDINLKTI